MSQDKEVPTRRAKKARKVAPARRPDASRAAFRVAESAEGADAGLREKDRKDDRFLSGIGINCDNDAVEYSFSMTQHVTAYLSPR